MCTFISILLENSSLICGYLVGAINRLFTPSRSPRACTSPPPLLRLRSKDYIISTKAQSLSFENIGNYVSHRPITTTP